MTAVQFDSEKVAKMTTRQMHDFYQANRRGYFDKLAETIAAVAASCPEEWGAPDVPDTYANRPYRRDFKPVVRAFSELANETDVADVPDLEFDLDAISAKDMSAFFVSVSANNLAKVADVLTRVVVKCPPKWGKADAAETYLERPYAQFLGIVHRFIREVNSDSGE